MPFTISSLSPKKRIGVVISFITILLLGTLTYYYIAKESNPVLSIQGMASNQPMEEEPSFYPEKHIDQHVAQYAVHSRTMGIMHLLFESFVKPQRIRSLRKHQPLLGERSQRALSMFVGSPANPGFSFCSNFAKDIGLASPLALYLNLMAFICANNDPDRIENNKRRLILLSQNHRLTQDMLVLYKKALKVETAMYFVLAQDQLASPMGRSLSLVQAEKIVPAFVFEIEKKYTGKEESSLKKTLETSQTSVDLIKFTSYDMGIIELVNERESHIKKTKRIWNSIKWLGSIIFSKPEWDTKERGILLHGQESPSLYTFFNALWSRINAAGRALWSFITLDWRNWLPNCWNILFPGQESQMGFAPNGLLGSLGNALNSIGNGLGYVWAPFEALLTFTTSLNKLFFLWRDLIGLYQRWKASCNILLRTVQQCHVMIALMSKAVRLIDKYPEVKAICGNEMRNMRRLANNKKVKRSMRKTKKLIKYAPVTMWDLVPFVHGLGGRMVYILANSKEFIQNMKEMNDLIKRALVEFYQLNVNIALADRIYLSNQKLAKNSYAIAQVAQNTPTQGARLPGATLQRAYTYVNAPDIIRNPIHIGNGDKNVYVLMALNASGKSTFARALFHNVVAAAAHSILLADGGSVIMPNKLLFSANISDDPAKRNSLMAAQVGELMRMLSGTEDPSQTVLVGMDEPLTGAPSKETASLLYFLLEEFSKRKNTTTLVATHLTELPHIADKRKFKDFAYLTTEFTEKEGFTYKIIEGRPDKPISIYLLQKLNFNKQILGKVVAHLRADSTYEFREALPGGKVIKWWKYLKRLLWLLFAVLVIAGGVVGYRRRKLKVKKN